MNRHDPMKEPSNENAWNIISSWLLSVYNRRTEWIGMRAVFWNADAKLHRRRDTSEVADLSVSRTAHRHVSSTAAAPHLHLCNRMCFSFCKGSPVLLEPALFLSWTAVSSISHTPLSLEMHNRASAVYTNPSVFFLCDTFIFAFCIFVFHFFSLLPPNLKHIYVKL